MRTETGEAIIVLETGRKGAELLQNALLADMKKACVDALVDYARKLNHTHMKQKVMFSQPMAGLTDEQIVATRDKAVAYLEANGYELVNTLFTDEWYSKDAMADRGVVQIPLCFLAKGLENMALCHAVYFAKGWEKARGCKIEHAVALAYGLKIIYEDKVELTRGQQVMSVQFNPGQREDVAAIKQIFADAYDEIDKHIKSKHAELASVPQERIISDHGGVLATDQDMIWNDASRLAAIAKTNLETAQMYAVKAVTR